MPTPEETLSVGTEVAPVVRPPHADAQFAPGTIIAGRYRIIGLLGAGGMGEVFRADDLKLGQAVALKFLPARFAHRPVLLARLHDEVRLGRLIAHPNVCRIYDIVEWEGAHFVTMEYVEGEDLARLLKRIGRFAPDKAADIARGVAAGLMAAHAKGVLHRDLKPANVMIDASGDPRIMDFGLALSTTDAQDGVLAGTPAYVAPEQLEGIAASVQSDLYALGLVMYEILTGRRVHQAKSFNERAAAVTDEIARPAALVRDIDPAVEAIVLRCLAIDPAERPRSAREVIEGLPGDPLAAAMAAGQTPSPRLIAAAPSVGSLKPMAAASLLALIALEIAFVFHAFRTQGVFGMRPAKPPEVLLERAADIRAGAGLPRQEFTSTGWQGDFQHLAWIASTDASSHRWTRLERGIAPMTFWVRQESRPLLRDATFLTPTASEPPQTTEGASTIVVDPEGRLLELSAVPHASWTARPLDWSGLFAAAGFDPARFTADEPRALPEAYADTRVAWKGRHPGDGTPIRVEAAAWRGTPVFFRVFGPWDDARDLTGTLPFAGKAGRAFVLARAATLVAFVVVGVLLAWRNLRLRRGDRLGAIRVAVVMFALQMIAIVGTADHALSAVHEMNVVLKAAATALLWTSGYFLVYIALEPFVRRRWPDRLISWVRLLSGHWRDPMVGRDTLIGVAAGLGHVVIAFTPYVLGLGPILPPTTWLRNAFAPIAGIAHYLQYGIVQGLTVMIALVTMTIVLRRRSLAALAVFALLFFIFQFASSDARMLPVFAAGAALVAFVAARFGLLTMVVYCAVFGLFVANTFPTELSWYTPRLLIAPAFVVLLAMAALYSSLGRSAWLPARVDAASA